MKWMSVLKYDEDAEREAKLEMLKLGEETNKKIVEALKAEVEKLKSHISRSVFFPEIDFEFINENVRHERSNKINKAYVRFKITPRVNGVDDELTFEVVTFIEKPRNTFIGHKMASYHIYGGFDGKTFGTLSEYYAEGDINRKIHDYLKNIFKGIREEFYHNR